MHQPLIQHDNDHQRSRITTATSRRATLSHSFPLAAPLHSNNSPSPSPLPVINGHGNGGHGLSIDPAAAPRWIAEENSDAQSLSSAHSVHSPSKLGLTPSPALLALTPSPGPSPHLDRHTIRTACLYIECGLHGRSVGYDVSSPEAITRARRLHTTAYFSLYMILASVHMSLALAEPPMTPSQSEVGLVASLALLEALLCCFYVYDLYLLYVCFGRWRVIHHKWARLRLITIIIIVSDLVLFFLFSFTFYRFSRPLRPLLLVSRARNVRKLLSSVCNAIANVIGIFVLLIFAIIFFGLLGYLLLCNYNVSGEHTFGSLPSAFYALSVIELSYSYVVVYMAPYYVTSRWSALFFLSYVILTTLFVAKLVIAIGYKAFKSDAKEKLIERIHTKKKAFRLAWEMVAQPASVNDSDERMFTLQTWLLILAELRPHFSVDIGSLLFHTIDSADTGAIDWHQFQSLMPLLNVQVTVTSSLLANVLARFPRLHQWRERMSELIKRKFFFFNQPIAYSQFFVTLLVIVSAVQLYFVAPSSASQRSDYYAWFILGIFLLMLFLADIILKLFCMGLTEYLNDNFNRLDCVCGVAGVLFYVYHFVTLQKESALLHAYNLALGIRFLRTLRLLQLSRACDDVLVTIDRVAPSILRLFVLFGSILYSFAIIGQSLYSSGLTCDNPTLASTDWAKSLQCQQLNFSDFFSSLIVLFQTANIGNWMIPLQAALLLDSPPVAVSYFYFFSLRIIVSTVFLPLFIGVIIDTFVRNWDVAMEEQEKKRREELEKEERRHQFRRMRAHRVLLEKKAKRKAERFARCERDDGEPDDEDDDDDNDDDDDDEEEEEDGAAKEGEDNADTSHDDDADKLPPLTVPPRLSDIGHLRTKSLFSKSFIVPPSRRAARVPAAAQPQPQRAVSAFTQDLLPAPPILLPFSSSPGTSPLMSAQPEPQQRVRFTLKRKNSEVQAHALDISAALAAMERTPPNSARLVASKSLKRSHTDVSSHSSSHSNVSPRPVNERRASKRKDSRADDDPMATPTKAEMKEEISGAHHRRLLSEVLATPTTSAHSITATPRSRLSQLEAKITELEASLMKKDEMLESLHQRLLQKEVEVMNLMVESHAQPLLQSSSALAIPVPAPTPAPASVFGASLSLTPEFLSQAPSVSRRASSKWTINGTTLALSPHMSHLLPSVPLTPHALLRSHSSCSSSPPSSSLPPLAGSQSDSPLLASSLT